MDHAAFRAPPLAMVIAVIACRGTGDSAPRPAEQPVGARDATAVSPEKPDPARDAAPGPRHWTFDSPRAALAHVLSEASPRVLGVGEYHQLTGSAPVASALRRFTDDMVEPLAAVGSDLIVETWIAEPGCGEKAREAQKQVETAIQRPPVTENELVTLLSRAAKLGLARHVLSMSCADHQSLFGAGGAEVDYWKLLVLVGRRLGDKARDVLAHRRGGDKMIVLYGGAQHNDLYPYDSLAEVSYAATIDQLTPGRYVELDLYVPELIRGDELLRGEGWYPLFESLVSPEREVLIERAPRSYILILRSGAAIRPAKPAKPE